MTVTVSSGIKENQSLRFREWMEGTGYLQRNIFKSIAPAIRVSYLVLPKPLLAVYKERVNFYTSTVSRIDQNILYQFMVSGCYERHLNRMRAVYKAKHDALIGALKPFEHQFAVKGRVCGPPSASDR